MTPELEKIRDSLEPKIKVSDNDFYNGFNAAVKALWPVVEALQWYKNLPMSDQDQLWTQELADQCIETARKALEKIGIRENRCEVKGLSSTTNECLHDVTIKTGGGYWNGYWTESIICVNCGQKFLGETDLTKPDPDWIFDEP